MALKIIVSYDDTDNDRDALALGRLLAYSGAELSLAYVRHSQGGALEEKQAEELLAQFETWRVEWIPRKENRLTDELGRSR